MQKGKGKNDWIINSGILPNTDEVLDLGKQRLLQSQVLSGEFATTIVYDNIDFGPFPFEPSWDYNKLTVRLGNVNLTLQIRRLKIRARRINCIIHPLSINETHTALIKT